VRRLEWRSRIELPRREIPVVFAGNPGGGFHTHTAATHTLRRRRYPFLCAATPYISPEVR